MILKTHTHAQKFSILLFFFPTASVTSGRKGGGEEDGWGLTNINIRMKAHHHICDIYRNDNWRFFIVAAMSLLARCEDINIILRTRRIIDILLFLSDF